MTKGQRSIINLLAIVAVVLTANLDAATPTNKLTNPGFETGDFAGWTVGGNSIQMGVDTDGTMIPNANPPFPPNFVNVRSDTYAGHALVRQNSVERIVSLRRYLFFPTTSSM